MKPIHVWRAVCRICRTIGEAVTHKEDRDEAKSIFRARRWTIRRRDEGGILCPRHGEHETEKFEREMVN